MPSSAGRLASRVRVQPRSSPRLGRRPGTRAVNRVPPDRRATYDPSMFPALPQFLPRSGRRLILVSVPASNVRWYGRRWTQPVRGGPYAAVILVCCPPSSRACCHHVPRPSSVR